jgi:hypothetical protein
VVSFGTGRYPTWSAVRLGAAQFIPARHWSSLTSLASRSFGRIACKWDIGWLDWTAREEAGKRAGLGRMFAVMAHLGGGGIAT